MDVYRQAAEIVQLVRDGHGTAKALCLRKDMQKKKQTYAVVCETLRHYDLLADVLRNAEFFQYYPRTSRSLAMVLCYDAVIGKGIRTRKDSTAVAIQDSQTYLQSAYQKVRKHHTIVPRSAEVWDEGSGSKDGSTTMEDRDLAANFPRYARVNTLKCAVEVLIERLRRPKRPRDDDDGRPRLTLPPFEQDSHIEGLLLFPPQTDLHRHPSVKSGQLVLQDKASCLPACVLMNAVNVQTADGIDGVRMPEFVLDACAAPGNKTTQLAALGAPNVKILAVERDARRSQILQQRITSLGAAEYVNAVNNDFFDLSSDLRDAAEAILLDPSCSASGVVSRVDISLGSARKSHSSNHKKDAAKQPRDVEDDEEEEEEGENDNEEVNKRVETLARVQKKLLTHAMLSFPNVHRVVYSTCSIHEAENEDVVRAVLSDERIRNKGWQLSHIMPPSGNGRVVWATRGWKKDDDVLPLDFTIRCDAAADRTNGFYVARFDRKLTVVEPKKGTQAKNQDQESSEAVGKEEETENVAAEPEVVDEEEVARRRQPPKRMKYDSDSD